MKAIPRRLRYGTQIYVLATAPQKDQRFLLPRSLTTELTHTWATGQHQVPAGTRVKYLATDAQGHLVEIEHLPRGSQPLMGAQFHVQLSQVTPTEEMVTKTMSFSECEHHGDAERYIDDLVKSGASIIDTQINFDAETCRITFEVPKSKWSAFLVKFKQTDSYGF